MAGRDPDLCARCEYDLTGSAQVGSCPECGNVYNRVKRRGIKRLESAQERFERRMRRARTLLVGAMGISILFCSGVLGMQSQRMLAIGLFIGGLVLMGAVVSWLSEKEDRGEE